MVGEDSVFASLFTGHNVKHDNTLITLSSHRTVLFYSQENNGIDFNKVFTGERELINEMPAWLLGLKEIYIKTVHDDELMLWPQ